MCDKLSYILENIWNSCQDINKKKLHKNCSVKLEESRKSLKKPLGPKSDQS